MNTQMGVERLLEAAVIAEAEKTSVFLHEELGIPEELFKTITSV